MACGEPVFKWEVAGLFVEPGLSTEKAQTDCSLDCCSTWHSSESQAVSSLETRLTVNSDKLFARGVRDAGLKRSTNPSVRLSNA